MTQEDKLTNKKTELHALIQTVRVPGDPQLFAFRLGMWMSVVLKFSHFEALGGQVMRKFFPSSPSLPLTKLNFS